MAKSSKTTTKSNKGIKVVGSFRHNENPDYLSGKGVANGVGHGIDVKTKNAMKEASASDLDQARQVYGKIVNLIDKLPDIVARIACLAAVSEGTFDNLAEIAQTAPAIGPKLGERDQARIEAIEAQFGKDDAEKFRQMLLFGKTAAKTTRGDKE